ncbi:hypothetical protein LCGC14_1991520 [marine sediment metagenome]|uniref:Uncharacterized protein n=1 Tax=marine sediment metagenome TaxID=412755 RepID=A0A0F9F675_9ZZZZ
MKSNNETQAIKKRSHTSILQSTIAKWKRGELSSEEFTFALIGLSSNTDMLERKTVELEADNAALQRQVEKVRLAANSLLGLIDCLGGGRDLDDAGPDRKQLAELVDYPKGLEVGGKRDCDNCSITGLLCPIRNDDPPFSFPCPHWQPIPELPPSDAGELLELGD